MAAASTMVFGNIDEFFNYATKCGLLAHIFDSTKVDALVDEYKIPPNWIDDIYSNAVAYFEAFLIETNQMDIILGKDEDAIEHILMCTEIPIIAQTWVYQIQSAHVHEDFDDLIDSLYLDNQDEDFFDSHAPVAAAHAPVAAAQAPVAAAHAPVAAAAHAPVAAAQAPVAAAHAPVAAAAHAPVAAAQANECRFGARCTRADCKFTHTAVRAMPECRFGARCTRADCKFTHTAVRAMPECRFGTRCTRADCKFTHAMVPAPAVCNFENDYKSNHLDVPPCNGRACMNGNNCYKQGKTCTFHHPGDMCQH
jgi:hypothetical protein